MQLIFSLDQDSFFIRHFNGMALRAAVLNNVDSIVDRYVKDGSMCIRNLNWQSYIYATNAKLELSVLCDTTSIESRSNFSYSLDSTIRRKSNTEVLYMIAPPNVQLISNSVYMSNSYIAENGQFYFLTGRLLFSKFCHCMIIYLKRQDAN